MLKYAFALMLVAAPALAQSVSQIPPPASDSAVSAVLAGPFVSITPQGVVKICAWPDGRLECGPTDISPVPMPPTRLTVSLAQALSAALADNERLRQEIEMLHRHVEVLTNANASMVDYVNLAGRYCPRPPK